MAEGVNVRGEYMAGNLGLRIVKAAISAVNTIALKTRAVTKVLVDALPALFIPGPLFDLIE